MAVFIIILIVVFAIAGLSKVWGCYNKYVELNNNVSAAKDMVKTTYRNYLRARDTVPELERQFSDIDVNGNQVIIKSAGTASMSGVFLGSTERYPHYRTQKSGVQTFSQYIQPFIDAKAKYIEASRILNTYMDSFPQSLFQEQFGFHRENPEFTIQMEIDYLDDMHSQTARDDVRFKNEETMRLWKIMYPDKDDE